MDSFINGTFNEEKFLHKMAKKGESEENIEEARKHIENFSKFIGTTMSNLVSEQPIKRTAFQIQAMIKVRIVIDSDIYFIREDAFDKQRPA